jgi:hypothetical protein
MYALNLVRIAVIFTSAVTLAPKIGVPNTRFLVNILHNYGGWFLYSVGLVCFLSYIYRENAVKAPASSLSNLLKGAGPLHDAPT